jgi:2-methylisocitrate lyase-like PEP mutase family enzyme
MTKQESQSAKAELFRSQHHDSLVMLPNIWDAMGAKLMELLGFPSVATASVATAVSSGYADGEHIPFSKLLEIVGKIVSAVDLPVTVDIERGYASNISQLKENIKMLIEQGGVGINLEDSNAGHTALYTIAEQCKKIEAVKETGIKLGVPLVINARTDIFVLNKEEDPVGEAIRRGLAFKSAGADCFYPILINNYDAISRIVEEVKMPVNVNLLKPISDLRRLEQIGVARVSVGPQLLYHVITTMKEMAESLLLHDSTFFFSRKLVSREFLNQLVEPVQK